MFPDQGSLGLLLHEAMKIDAGAVPANREKTVKFSNRANRAKTVKSSNRANRAKTVETVKPASTTKPIARVNPTAAANRTGTAMNTENTGVSMSNKVPKDSRKMIPFPMLETARITADAAVKYSTMDRENLPEKIDVDLTRYGRYPKVTWDNGTQYYLDSDFLKETEETTRAIVYEKFLKKYRKTQTPEPPNSRFKPNALLYR